MNFLNDYYPLLTLSINKKTQGFINQQIKTLSIYRFVFCINKGV